MNPPVLEKQLVSLDLSKGVDERTRPELLSGAANITALDNLLQDQNGAWVKRPGTQIGPSIDGALYPYPVSLKKVLNLVSGWGVIANGGCLLHKQDSQDTFRKRQPVMDFSVTTARFSGSSGPQATDGQFGSGVLAATGSSTHDVFIVRGLTTFPYGFSERLVISERLTGVEYSYDLSKVAGIGSGQYRAMCIVTDRYLHLYESSGTGTGVIIMDLLATMPADVTALAALVHTIDATATVSDCVSGASASYVSVYNTGGLAPSIMKVDNSGTILATWTGAGARVKYLAVNEAMTTLFYSNGSTITGLDSGTLVASIVAFGPSNISGICCDSSNNVYAAAKTTASVGGTTVDVIKSYVMTGAAGAGTLVGACYGWTPVSHPFFVSAAGKVFMHVVKNDPSASSTVAQHAIMDLSTFVGLYSNTAGLGTPFGAFRIACQLEPFNGYRSTGVEAAYGSGQAYHFHYQCDDGFTFTACVPYLAAARTAGVGMLRCRYTDSTSFGSANFCGSTYIAHGGLNQYDGANLVEQGFADTPIVDKVTPAATAGNLNGAYRYVAVYRHVDSNGVSAYSRTCNPVAATNVAATTGKNNITVSPPGLTNRDSGHGESAPVVDLYRTKSGGTIFYLCATSQQNVTASTAQQLAVDATTGLYTVTDNLSDATLGAQAVMYRQPGTVGAPADRYPAPASKLLCQHKDRLFCADPYGQRVYYSSFFVDGEAAWFNPAFSFYVHDGSGPITALASMDGRLFVFKRDQIFVVDGDGPGEMGPTGNEFSPPQALASRFGCIDHRSVVVTPDGIMYRSSRGIEILTRNLQVKWVGDRVWSTVGQNPITTGACLDSSGRVHILCSEGEDALGVYGRQGVELIYDTTNDSWSTHRYTGAIGTYGSAKQSVAEVLSQGKYVLAYCDGYASAYTIATDYIDAFYNAYVPFKIETGWIKQGPQARQRVTEVLFLAKKAAAANHAIKVSIAYNYSDTYTETAVFEPGVINAADIEELSKSPEIEQVLAIRVKIEDQAPADIGTYPVGSGQGCDILSITAEVAPKQGTPKLPAGQTA